MYFSVPSSSEVLMSFGFMSFGVMGGGRVDHQREAADALHAHGVSLDGLSPSEVLGAYDAGLKRSRLADTNRRLVFHDAAEKWCRENSSRRWGKPPLRRS